MKHSTSLWTVGNVSITYPQGDRAGFGVNIHVSKQVAESNYKCFCHFHLTMGQNLELDGTHSPFSISEMERSIHGFSKIRVYRWQNFICVGSQNVPRYLKENNNVSFTVWRNKTSRKCWNVTLVMLNAFADYYLSHIKQFIIILTTK